MVIKRAVTSCVALACFLGSLKYIPIGVANALQNTSPIFAFFIDVVYYKRVPVSSIGPGQNILAQSHHHPRLLCRRGAHRAARVSVQQGDLGKWDLRVVLWNGDLWGCF